MTAKSTMSAAVLLIASIALCPAPAAAEIKPAPVVKKVDIDKPFKHVYAGNKITVTMQAEAPNGISKAYVYLMTRKGVIMGDFRLTPTDEPGQLRGEFVVPAVRPGTDEPLPKDGYRALLSCYDDGEGNRIEHYDISVGGIYFNPDPSIGVVLKAGIASNPGAKGQALVIIENPTTTDQELELGAWVYDHFQNTVVAQEPKVQTFAPGKHEQKITFAAEDAKRFRAEVKWRVAQNDWQTLLQYANVDYLASGPRKERRIEGGKWQILVPAEAPATEPVYPPKGDWADTTYQLKPQWSRESNWTWFRQEVEPAGWLDGKRLQLRFGQADHRCVVYVNGQKVGGHFGEATPFAFDVTKQWRLDKPNVIEVAVGNYSTISFDPDKEDVVMFNLLTPMALPTPGIYQEVELVSLATTFIDDVFVMPSVKDGRLAVRTWLRNAGDTEATTVLSHAVEDGGENVLNLPDTTVTLAPGETRMIEQAGKWSDPTLWWPHAPYLYRLRTRLAGGGSKPLDELSTRFGFREITLDGPNVLMNGRIFRPQSLSISGSYLTQLVPDHEILDFWITRRKFNREQPILMRTHVRIQPRWLAEICDETGICIENEGQFNSNVFYRMDLPVFWKNAAQMLSEFVKRDRNYPSVVMWSTANEPLHAAGATTLITRDALAQELKKLAQVVKQLDPTRPVVEEGGADFDGTWEMLDLHYPRCWNNHVDWPNSAFWFKPGEMTANEGGQAPVVLWKGDKPASIGEEGIYFGTRQPHDSAVYLGDIVYGETGGYSTSELCHQFDDRVMADYIAGYRYGLVWRVSCDLGGSGGPHCDAAELRIRTFIWPRNRLFLEGVDVCREVTVFHDVLKEDRMRLELKVIAFVSRGMVDEDMIVDDKIELNLAAGQIERVPVNFKTLAVEVPTKLLLKVRLIDAATNETVFEQEQEGAVYPANPLQVPANAAIGLYDPAGATTSKLAELGIAKIKPVEALTGESLAGLQAIIIGEDSKAPAKDAAQALSDFVEAGGKAILLNTRWTPFRKLRPGPKSLEHTYCFVRAHDHPLMAGVHDQLLRLWSDDHVVSRGALAKSKGIGLNFMPIVDAGAPAGGGLAYAPVAEIIKGQGSYVVCQLRAVELADSVPGARMFLQNLLNYAAAPAYRKVKPAGVLLAEDSPEHKLLGELKAVVSDVADLNEFGTIIVDAHGVDGKAEQLRAFAESGGIVLVKGLTTDTQDKFAVLFKTPLELIADDQTRRPIQTRRDSITAGISNEELYWERRKGRFSWKAEEQIGLPVCNTLIKPAPALIDLYRTEPMDNHSKPAESRGASLVKIPVGSGWIVVDQTRWEAAWEKDPGGWGGTVAFATGLKRYVSYLLTNLGVQQH